MWLDFHQTLVFMKCAYSIICLFIVYVEVIDVYDKVTSNSWLVTLRQLCVCVCIDFLKLRDYINLSTLLMFFVSVYSGILTFLHNFCKYKSLYWHVSMKTIFCVSVYVCSVHAILDLPLRVGIEYVKPVWTCCACTQFDEWIQFLVNGYFNDYL